MIGRAPTGPEAMSPHRWTCCWRACRKPTTAAHPQEVLAGEEFRDLLRTVRAAKAEFRGRADDGLTRGDIDELIDRLRALEHTQPATYRALVEHLRAALGTHGQQE